MFGISAPQVAVRAAIPWYLRWLGLIVLASVILVVARVTYDFGKQFAGFDQSEADGELKRLNEAHQQAQQELAKVRGELRSEEHTSELQSH